jgi:hypothetical protein
MRKVKPIEVGIALIPPVGAKEIDYRIVQRIYKSWVPADSGLASDATSVTTRKVICRSAEDIAARSIYDRAA